MQHQHYQRHIAPATVRLASFKDCMSHPPSLTIVLLPPDEGGHGWGGHDGILPHNHLAEAVAGCQLDDDLGGLLAEVAAIAT
eukprot:1159637-Pelagomonas_calceolata.AAC.2